MEKINYEKVYERLLKRSIRKLGWLSLWGVGYGKFNEECERNQQEIYKIKSEAYKCGIKLNTKKLLGLEIRLMKLEVNRDLQALGRAL